MKGIYRPVYKYLVECNICGSYLVLDDMPSRRELSGGCCPICAALASLHVYRYVDHLEPTENSERK